MSCLVQVLEESISFLEMFCIQKSAIVSLTQNVYLDNIEGYLYILIFSYSIAWCNTYGTNYNGITSKVKTLITSTRGNILLYIFLVVIVIWLLVLRKEPFQEQITDIIKSEALKFTYNVRNTTINLTQLSSKMENQPLPQIRQ